MVIFVKKMTTDCTDKHGFFLCYATPYGVQYVHGIFICRGSHPCLCYVNPTDLGHAEAP